MNKLIEKMFNLLFKLGNIFNRLLDKWADFWERKI
jgi:hypothetical protein